MEKPGVLRPAWSAVQEQQESSTIDIIDLVSTEAGPEDGADQWKSQGHFISK